MKYNPCLAAAVFVLAPLSISSAQPAPKPVAILFSGDTSSNDTNKAVLEVRKGLRASSQVTVISYDPESPAVKRASREKNQPTWATVGPQNDADKAALAAALGADFVIVVDRQRNEFDSHLMSTRNSDSVVEGHDRSVDGLSRLLLSQIFDPKTAAASIVRVPPPVRPPIPLPIVPLQPAVVAAQPHVPTVVIPLPAVPAPIAPAQAAVPAVVKPAQPAAPANTAAPIVVVPARPAVPIVVIPLPAVPAPIAPAQAAVPAVVKPAQPAAPANTAAPIVVVPARPAVPNVVQNQPVIPIVPEPAHDTVVVHLPPRTAVPQIPPTLDASANDTVPVHVLAETPAAPPAAISDEELHRRANQLAAIQKTLNRGDNQLDLGNVVEAIGIYRQAINDAPFAGEPRVKLAKAYLEAGMREQALSEAQRALDVAPDDKGAQDFLIKLDLEDGNSSGAIIRYNSLLKLHPNDANAHIGLGDALWNAGKIDDAEVQFKLAEAGNPADHIGADRLARLLASKDDFAGVLALVRSTPGWNSYPALLRIVQSRTELVQAGLTTGRDSLTSQTKTRAEIYASAKDLDKQAQKLSDFVGQIVPSAQAKISHLHRIQSVDLLAQETAIFVRFLETNDDDQQTQLSRLEKSVSTEILTAHAAEVKAGLWPDPKSDTTKG